MSHSDWRRIEAVMTEHFERAGFYVSRQGDRLVEMRGSCLLAMVDAAERCQGIGDREVNLTELAHALAEEVVS
jgi:hypothetical protein